MISNHTLLFCTNKPGNPFDIDAPEKPSNKKQYEKTIDAATQKLKELIKKLEQQEQNDTIHRSVSRALIVDSCAQITHLNEEYKKQENPVSYFFFQHPRLYDTTLVCAGFFAGIATYWLFLS